MKRKLIKVGFFILRWGPVIATGFNNLREQLSYGVGEPWSSWTDKLSGWVLWALGVLLWLSIVGAFQRFLRYREHQAVINEFQQALVLKPTDPYLWYNFGLFYVEIGRLDKAHEVVQKLKEIDAEQAKLLQTMIERPDLRCRGVDVLFGLSH